DSAAVALQAYAPPPMLTPGIHKAYEAGVESLSEHNQVETIARGRVGEGVNQGQGALFAADAASPTGSTRPRAATAGVNKPRLRQLTCPSSPLSRTGHRHPSRTIVSPCANRAGTSAGS